MNRKAFTMVELIFVIVIIGLLSAVAVPKFSGVKDRARMSTELATASAISVALENIHGEWSTSDGDFDWNNDGVVDDIDKELAASGYPLNPIRNSDDLGALLKSHKSGFTNQNVTLTNASNTVVAIYTGKASNSTTGIKFPKVASSDIEGKPDKNDFWLYVIDTNNTKECYVDASNIKKRQIISGDFVLIDVNTTTSITFSSDITIDCS